MMVIPHNMRSDFPSGGSGETHLIDTVFSQPLR